jgi:hypothetical protein
MTKVNLNINTVSQRLSQPLHEQFPHCDATRVCPALPDMDWLQMGLTRVLHECKSGRGFLQEYGGRFPQCPQRSTFFESLQSPRRAHLLQQINRLLQKQMTQQIPDRLAVLPELDGFCVYAGDGHWHAAAAHDPVVDGIKYATGHFFGLNLRTQGIVHLTAADQQARLKEHDMRALKRLETEILRQGAPVGRKVLWIWDKAGIDFQQWHRWKQAAGIYFASCAKDNMTLEVIGQNAFDRQAAINQGVLADELVSTSTGVMVRLVTYYDPVRKETFRFLTNELTLLPGIIAHLYRLRWDIEKVFDEFKNKLAEKKAWASGQTAKTIQAQFMCLMHNLLVLFEQLVLVPEGIHNQAEDRRRQKRLQQVKTTLQQQGQKLAWLVEALQRCTQRSVKLIRWLRSHFFLPTSCSQALEALRALYATL